MRVKLKYVTSDCDRHGNVRYYFRRRGSPKIRLRGIPGSEEFMQTYQAALRGVGAQTRQYRRALAGSFRELCQNYYSSRTFSALDASTQSWRRRALDLISAKDGDKPVALIESKHVRQLRDQLVRAAANQRLKALKALFGWAFEEGKCASDPTTGVKKVKYATSGHHACTSDEIEQYKQRHPLGTKPRLAFDLLRFTTGRREDIPRLGPQHMRNGRIRFRQAKNEDRNPIEIDIPVHPDLAASIAACRSEHLTFLTTEWGKPYSTAGFGNAVRDWFNQANLPHCSAHSLRKSTPTQMAENGATPHELMAITGHQTLGEVERYTRSAQKNKLADTAMSRLK